MKEALSPGHTQFVFGILNFIGDAKNDCSSFMLSIVSDLNALVLFVDDLVEQRI